jgi:hypothetical protein
VPGRDGGINVASYRYPAAVGRGGQFGGLGDPELAVRVREIVDDQLPVDLQCELVAVGRSVAVLKRHFSSAKRAV